MSAIDWSTLSTEDALVSIRSAPKIAGPWKDCNSICVNGGPGTLTKNGMWNRASMHPGPEWISFAHVQGLYLGGFLWTTSHDGPSGLTESKEEAMAAADAALSALGVRLMGAGS